MIQDFEELGLTGRKKFKDSDGIDGEYGFLPDRRKVTIRVTSSDERPTLDIEKKPKSTDKKIKVRYDDQKSKNNIQ